VKFQEIFPFLCRNLPKFPFLALDLIFYLKLFRAKVLEKQSKLKISVLQLKNDLAHTSSQDEFAKWAKIQRRIDSGVAELEKINTDLAFFQTSFNLRFRTLFYIFTNGLQIILVFWFRKSAVFYVPNGWFGPVEWCLSFPFAPRRSVSVMVWFFVCNKVIRNAEGIFRGLSESSRWEDVEVEKEKTS